MDGNLKKNEFAAFSVDAQAKQPLYRQFYEKIRQAILNRQFAPGLKLPATRRMASEFGVSRNTIAAAYDQLIAEGYLETRIGSGTFVSQKLPDDFLKVEPAKILSPLKNERNRNLSKRGKIIAEANLSLMRSDGAVRPFLPGVPSVEDFPFQIWAKLSARRLKKPIRSLLNYGNAAGFKPLRELIAAHLGTSRGVACDAEQVVIVSGTQQAIDLTARILLDAGDAAWMEEPGYLGMRGALLAAQAKIVGVPVDAEGLNVEAGKKLAPEAKLICVTPSHQYPLGVTMSLKRRLELLKWASESGAWILEDDYDSEFRYETRPLAALQSLDAGGRVIYTGTFSKVLSPALRLGYVVAPPDLVDAFVSAKMVLDRHSSIFEQVVLADFISENHFVRHIRRMRNLYAERREWFVSALKSEMDELIEIIPSSAGLHLTIRLKKNIDDLDTARRAANAGIVSEPLSALCLNNRSARPGLVLGYAPFNRKEIKKNVKILATVLRQ